MCSIVQFEHDESAPSIRGGHQAMTEVFRPGPHKPLNPPYGGTLVNLVVDASKAAQVCACVLSDASMCELRAATL